MWLEHGHEPPVLERPRAPEGGGDLGRVMGVVVVDERPAGAVAEQLKATRRPAKAGDAGDRQPGVGAGPPGGVAARRRR